MNKKDSLYNDLGVDKNADKATIKRAYKRKAQRAHPDKGGSAEVFQAVQLAYAVLSDDTRRQRYDATGDTEQRQDNGGQAATILGNMILALVDEAPEHDDLIGVMRQMIDANVARAKKEINSLRARIKKRQKAIAKIKHTGQRENILHAALEGHIERLRQSIIAGENDLALAALMMAMLDDYTYEHADAPPRLRDVYLRFETQD